MQPLPYSHFPKGWLIWKSEVVEVDVGIDAAVEAVAIRRVPISQRLRALLESLFHRLVGVDVIDGEAVWV